MTVLYREEPFFNQTCTLLHLLMDVENAVWQWRCEYLSRDILVFSRAVYRSSSGSSDVIICLETFWSSAGPYTGHHLAVTHACREQTRTKVTG